MGERLGTEETPEGDGIKSMTQPSKPLFTKASIKSEHPVISPVFLTIPAPEALMWSDKVETQSPLHTHRVPRAVAMANYRNGNQELLLQPAALIPI